MGMGFVILNVVFLITCVSVSFAFKNHYPKDINSFVGYRTRRSMSSKEAWLDANEYASSQLFKYSFVAVIIQVALFFAINAKIALLTSAGVWILFLLLTLVQTEVKLRRSYP
jgi:uncharacterized membrane protein